MIQISLSWQKSMKSVSNRCSPWSPKCKHVCKTIVRQPVYTRKYLKKQTQKHHPEQSLWSKCRQLLGCKGNWWLNLAPPRSPDFSFVTEFLFRNILHLHTNPIFFLNVSRFLSNRNTRIPSKDDSDTQIMLKGASFGHILPWRARAFTGWDFGAWEEEQGLQDSSSWLSALIPPHLVRHCIENLRLRSGRK